MIIYPLVIFFLAAKNLTDFAKFLVVFAFTVTYSIPKSFFI